MDTMTIAVLIGGAAAAAAALGYLAGCVITRREKPKVAAAPRNALSELTDLVGLNDIIDQRDRTIIELEHSLTMRDEAHAETLMKSRLHPSDQMLIKNITAELEVEQAYHRADVAELETAKANLVMMQHSRTTNRTGWNVAIDRIAGLKRELDQTEAGLKSTQADLTQVRKDAQDHVVARMAYFDMLSGLYHTLRNVPDWPPRGTSWGPVIEARDKLRKWEKQWRETEAPSPTQI